MVVSPIPKPAAAPSRPHVLIVDDEAWTSDALQAILGRDGYDFTVARSGAEAEEALVRRIPDVILLDVMMPGEDGLEICGRIKANPRLEHIPVILVTVLETKDDLARGLGAGADDFLSKPVSPIELRARVRSMLRIKEQHDRLKAALEMREELANMIVHDMRSPLATITAHADWISQGKGDRDDSAAVIRSEAQRLERFLHDMLLLAKLESGKLVLARAEADPAELARTALDQQRPTAEARGVTLALTVPPKRRRVSLDPTLFVRTVGNLVSNAIKYSDEGDTVRLVIRFPREKTSPAGLRVEVHDKGVGIPDADKERIFASFETAGGAPKSGTQIGLGLRFVQLAAEAHGGRVSVTDNQPKGSIFVVEL